MKLFASYKYIALVLLSTASFSRYSSCNAWVPHHALSHTSQTRIRSQQSPSLIRVVSKHLDAPAATTTLGVASHQSSSSSSSSTTGGTGGGAIHAEDFPQLGEDGIWHIQNKIQHTNFLEANKNRLVVMKVFAPWCRACKGMYM